MSNGDRKFGEFSASELIIFGSCLQIMLGLHIDDHEFEKHSGGNRADLRNLLEKVKALVPDEAELDC